MDKYPVEEVGGRGGVPAPVLLLTASIGAEAREKPRGYAGVPSGLKSP